MNRFGQRWRLVGGGLSNVWRFGNLDLAANSGRLLLRGPNGTGKTTALEVLWPYLLDLDAARLSAGKGRSTNLASLMREEKVKRRYGYVWMTLADPNGALISFGVRLQFSDGGSPPVRVVPFTVPGRPLHDLDLWATGGAALTADQFEERVTACGGQIFVDETSYLSHLAARVFETSNVREIALLATRLRNVRNPSLLGEVSAVNAADALRDSLPGVNEDTIVATAEALDESKTTREAFERDRVAADLLGEISVAWSGHAIDVVNSAQRTAAEAADRVRKSRQQVNRLDGELERTTGALSKSGSLVAELESNIAERTSEISALEQGKAYEEALLREELARRLEAERGRADTAARAMVALAAGIRKDTSGLREQIIDLADDVDASVSAAAGADPTLELASKLLSWSESMRPPIVVGDVSADPGPSLVIRGTSDDLREASSVWAAKARDHKQNAESAGLALVDHKAVAKALEDSKRTSDVAGREALDADRHSQRLVAVQASTVARVRELHQSIEEWRLAHRDLDGDFDVELMPLTEPARVLSQADSYALDVTTHAETRAATLRESAVRERVTATAMRTEAAELHRKAAGLRGGVLQPFPRPSWAGPGDDSIALGSVVDWSESVSDATERALLEAALSISGVLGATVGVRGLTSGAWHVDPAGPVVAMNLGDVLVLDSAHPAASHARLVLERIAVVPSAGVADDGGTTLVIGRDGTFRAGVLFGRAPGAVDPHELAPPSHVGAKQRRAAAEALAVEHEREATRIDGLAADCDERASKAEKNAAGSSAAGRAFPSRDALREAESRRSGAEELSGAAQQRAAEARRTAESVAVTARDIVATWKERVAALGLPTELVTLTHLRDHGHRIAESVRTAARTLQTKLADRLQRIFGELGRLADLTGLEIAVQDTHANTRTARETKTRLDTIEATLGDEIKDVMRRRDLAFAAKKQLSRELEPARSLHDAAVREEVAVRLRLETAQVGLEAAIPVAQTALFELRRLFSVAGIAEAALDGADLPADDNLLSFVQTKVAGRATRAKRTVRELVDQARARLAGTWAIDPGEDHGELLTWILTHRDAVFSPPQAAAHAAKMKERAERALAATEERALQEFVIGRLPTAISSGWARLHDWIEGVNKKMRSASASSGVCVQVRAPVRSDLAEHERVIYELSCKTSGATRTQSQEQELASALHAVILAAEGDSMRERVDRATDIRKWLDVHYEVTRGDGKTQRWGLRTGLSTGERRLVVLAPMLAAVAAQYERFGQRALRLVALDEIPVEVDTRGRDGLARYIAQLDLDLVCTSHEWDGCPGAWDGIDAHELEAGLDQMVVAFPMVVRGAGPLPGDPPWRLE